MWLLKKMMYNLCLVGSISKWAVCNYAVTWTSRLSRPAVLFPPVIVCLATVAPSSDGGWSYSRNAVHVSWAVTHELDKVYQATCSWLVVWGASQGLQCTICHQPANSWCRKLDTWIKTWVIWNGGSGKGSDHRHQCRSNDSTLCWCYFDYFQVSYLPLFNLNFSEYLYSLAKISRNAVILILVFW